jgi:Nucleotide modification associated domain 2
MTLFSYCLRFDDGAAPNPYWGVCTLAICKPAIRRMARKSDWVLGLGSKNAPRLGNISGDMVYAMKVTRVMPMQEYDEFCRESLPGKIPDWASSDFRRRVGDCIYDFESGDKLVLRRSVHTERNRRRDLSGRNVLLSTRFYYFGDEPESLPKRLLALAHPTQGHKSHANDAYVDDFVKWIEDRGWKRNTILGEPQLKDKILSMTKQQCRSFCSEQHKAEDERDEVC